MKQQGFSIIELLVVVAIVSALTAIAMPIYKEYVERSKFTEVVNQVGQLRNVLYGAKNNIVEDHSFMFWDFEENNGDQYQRNQITTSGANPCVVMIEFKNNHFNRITWSGSNGSGSTSNIKNFPSNLLCGVGSSPTLFSSWYPSGIPTFPKTVVLSHQKQYAAAVYVPAGKNIQAGYFYVDVGCKKEENGVGKSCENYDSSFDQLDYLKYTQEGGSAVQLGTCRNWKKMNVC